VPPSSSGPTRPAEESEETGGCFARELRKRVQDGAQPARPVLRYSVAAMNEVGCGLRTESIAAPRAVRVASAR
jgi:hypothetical protein